MISAAATGRRPCRNREKRKRSSRHHGGAERGLMGRKCCFESRQESGRFPTRFLMISAAATGRRPCRNREKRKRSSRHHGGAERGLMGRKCCFESRQESGRFPTRFLMISAAATGRRPCRNREKRKRSSRHHGGAERGLMGRKCCFESRQESGRFPTRFLMISAAATGRRPCRNREKRKRSSRHHGGAERGLMGRKCCFESRQESGRFPTRFLMISAAATGRRPCRPKRIGRGRERRRNRIFS